MYSPLQILSFATIDNIIQYILYSSRSQQCLDTSTATQLRLRQHAKTLLHISHVWRQLTMRELCKGYLISVTNNARSYSSGFTIWPPYMRKTETGDVRYVRSLSITMENESALMLGLVGQLFRKSKLDEMCFPFATTLHLAFRSAGVVNGNSWSPGRIQTVVNDIKETFLYIRKLVPNVKRIEVVCEKQAVTGYKAGADVLYTTILEYLARGIDSVSFVYDNFSHAMENKGGLVGCVLTNVVYDWCTNNSSFLQILYQYSDCLESLTIRDMDRNVDLDAISLDGHGRAMCYSRLTKLSISTREDQDIDIQNLGAPSGRVIFPALRSITVRSWQFLKDDSLFCGNENTLQYVSIKLGKCLAKCISKYSLFSLSRHTNLCSLELLPDGEIEQGLRTLTDKHLQYIITHGGHIQRFVVSSTFSCQRLADILSSWNYLPNLKILHLGGATRPQPSMRNVLRIIQHLPCLTELYSGLTQSDFNRSLSESDLFTYCLKAYVPDGRSLRYWSVLDGTQAPVRLIAITAITIAAICPSFTFAALPVNRMPTYNKTVELLLEREPFAQFKSRAETLIFKCK